MKTTIIQPYLFFNGRCDEALEFYRATLGAQVDFVMRYNESPEPLPPGRLPAGFENKVMHATFHIGATTLMASDGCCTEPNFAGFSLSLAVPSATEAHRVFDALAVGGRSELPLTKTFWSPCFGMLTDHFGVGWMISVMP